MNAILLCAALAAAQDRPATRDAGVSGSNAAAGQTSATASLDGTWAVVSASHDGTAVRGADRRVVAIRNNVISAAEAVGGASRQGQPLRLDFGRDGQVTVMALDPDAPAGPGETGRTDGSRATGPAGRPGGTDSTTLGVGSWTGARAGVYVLTPDYLAISVPGDVARRGEADRNLGAVGNVGSGPQGELSQFAVVLRRVGSGPVAAPPRRDSDTNRPRPQSLEGNRP